MEIKAITVETGVPLIEARGRKTGESRPPRARLKRNRYPFKDMQPGDSFLVPLDGDPLKVVRNRVARICTHTARTLGAKYTIRTTEEGLRVWRLQ